MKNDSPVELRGWRLDRTSETPLFQIVKEPKLARRQGAYSVVASGGRILKRGQDLGRVLGVFDPTLKLVGA